MGRSSSEFQAYAEIIWQGREEDIPLYARKTAIRLHEIASDLDFIAERERNR